MKWFAWIFFFSSMAYANVTKHIDLSKACLPQEMKQYRDGEEKKVTVRDFQLYIIREMNQSKEDSRLDRISDLKSSQNLRMTRDQIIQNYRDDIAKEKVAMDNAVIEMKKVPDLDAKAFAPKKEEYLRHKTQVEWLESLIKERDLENRWYESTLEILAHSAKEMGKPFRSGVKLVVNKGQLEMWRVASDSTSNVNGDSFKSVTSRPSFSMDIDKIPKDFLPLLQKGRVKNDEIFDGKATARDITKYPKAAHPNKDYTDGLDVLTSKDGSLVVSDREPGSVNSFYEIASLIGMKCDQNGDKPIPFDPGSGTVDELHPERAINE
jgi:hypothetical protein